MSDINLNIQFVEQKGFATAFEAPADREDGCPSHLYSTIERVTKGTMAVVQ